ncbi:MAG: gamma-glutamyl-gamma-aminobutyrate hydrolase family protein [Pseudomonadota bacterium]|nr:gamma-glutamyl-gamma-aminobutyrate hydrolase family protein [Pseudomonadota bacterium]
MTLRLLVVASETPTQRAQRRRHAGASSDETYKETLLSLRPDASVETISCVDTALDPPGFDLEGFDGVFFAGSPIDMQNDGLEARSAANFMSNVYQVGVPAFGSCAGLQIAAVAAGGRSEPRLPHMKAGFVRGITATDAGRRHPLLAGREIVWNAPAMHAQIVAELPEGGTLLARSRHTPVEAAEIRHANGVFYGVQYHPEISLAEIAMALRRETDDLIAQGLARAAGDVDEYAQMLEQLAEAPERDDLAWRLGLDDDVIVPAMRLIEIRNFLSFLT